MKLLWASSEKRNGAFYGYSVHQKELLIALRANGVEVTENPKDTFDIAVHICVPGEYEPLPGKRNILQTTCESSPIQDKCVLPPSKLADTTAIVVPTNFCQFEFAASHRSTPVETCPLGVDVERFRFVQRAIPHWDVFKVLWVGAWDERKGYDVAKAAWNKWLASGRMPFKSELILKTTDVSIDGMKHNGRLSMLAAHDGGTLKFVRSDVLPWDVPQYPRITIDSRDLSIEELARLYAEAHVFIFPTRAEGFGLTLLEAAATGLPCIYTDWSACHDTMDPETAFPLTRFKLRRPLTPGFGNIAFPEVNQVVDRLDAIVGNYELALEKGKAASARVRNTFTWDHAAKRFLEICEKYA